MASEVRTPCPISDLGMRNRIVLSGSMTTKALTSLGVVSTSGPQGSGPSGRAAARRGSATATSSPPAAETPLAMKERREDSVHGGAPCSEFCERGGAVDGGANARIGPAAADIGHH